MQIKDFEKHFAGHVPCLQDAAASFAVLVPIILQNRKPYLLFEVRADTLDRQPGEVCFPGGKMESGETPMQSAIRETTEELSIPEKEIHPISALDYIYHSSGTIIHPILASITKQGFHQLHCSKDEVKESFLVPFSFFLEHDPEIYSYRLTPHVSSDFPYEKIGFKGSYPWKSSSCDIPIYNYKGHVIWGITGRICYHLAKEMTLTLSKTSSYQHIEHPFPALFQSDSRILILGSFPSVKSREGMFFYNHPQNRFWKVIAAIVHEDAPKTIAEKRSMLLKHHIALWDVIHSCDIVGSSDSSIKNAVANDLTPILNGSQIQHIYTNGSTSGKLYERYIKPNLSLNHTSLPSTSPANAAFSLEKLIEIWGNALPKDL